MKEKEKKIRSVKSVLENREGCIIAPWAEEEVEALNKYQSLGIMHPYTCGSGNRKDKFHTDGEGVLVATKDGWVCPFCSYTQDWAYNFSLLPF